MARDKIAFLNNIDCVIFLARTYTVHHRFYMSELSDRMRNAKMSFVRPEAVRHFAQEIGRWMFCYFFSMFYLEKLFMFIQFTGNARIVQWMITINKLRPKRWRKMRQSSQTTSRTAGHHLGLTSYLSGFLSKTIEK